MGGSLQGKTMTITRPGYTLPSKVETVTESRDTDHWWIHQKRPLLIPCSHGWEREFVGSLIFSSLELSYSAYPLRCKGSGNNLPVLLKCTQGFGTIFFNSGTLVDRVSSVSYKYSSQTKYLYEARAFFGKGAGIGISSRYDDVTFLYVQLVDNISIL